MKLAKKITLGVFIALLLGAVIGLGIWVARNYSKITSETDLYTYEELLDHGEKRYEDGLQAGEDNRVLVEAYLKQIHSLENQKEELSLEIVRLKAEGYDDKERIEALEAQQLEYQNEITRLNGLLKAYENLANEVYEVSFYIIQPNGNNVLYETKLVKIGNSVTNVGTPEATNEYEFKFWTLDKQTEIDPLTTTISANTTFYGVVEEKFEVSFVLEGEVIETQYILGGNLAEAPTIDNQDFKGWYVDGVAELVDFGSYKIYEDTVIYAKIAKWTSLMSESAKMGDSMEIEVEGLKTNSVFIVSLEQLYFEELYQKCYWIVDKTESPKKGILGPSDAIYVMQKPEEFAYAQVNCGQTPETYEVYESVEILVGGTHLYKEEEKRTLTISFSCNQNGILTLNILEAPYEDFGGVTILDVVVYE